MVNMETDDGPLLTFPVNENGGDHIVSDFQYPQFLHGIWVNDAKEKSYSEIEVVDELQRASSFKSNLSQEPQFEPSQPLSQIFEPAQERQKVTRREAFDLLKQVSSAAEAAQKALEKVTGDEFVDASGDELQARDNILEKIRKRLSQLQTETKKRKRQLKNPDKTFLSSSACEEVMQLKKCRGDDKTSDEESEEVAQTETKGVQTDGGGLGPKMGAFQKPFDQLKVTGVYFSIVNLPVLVNLNKAQLCDFD